MNILVTGGTGRLGGRLVPRLLARGDDVRVLVRQPERAQHLEEQGAELFVGDLLRPDALAQAVKGTDAVIHLAAFFRGATEEETRAVNLEGTLALAAAALEAGVSRFVFASTNLVYGPGSGKHFREEDALQPEGSYPQTKAAAERALLELYHSRGLGLRMLRFAFVYGEGDAHLTEGMRWFRGWNPLQPIHMVHHTDVAQAVMSATDEKGIDGRIYNVADDYPVTAAEVMQLYGEPIPEDAIGRALDAAWLQIVDTRKIREELGFTPVYPALRHAAQAGAL